MTILRRDMWSLQWTSMSWEMLSQESTPPMDITSEEYALYNSQAQYCNALLVPQLMGNGWRFSPLTKNPMLFGRPWRINLHTRITPPYIPSLDVILSDKKLASQDGLKDYLIPILIRHGTGCNFAAATTRASCESPPNHSWTLEEAKALYLLIWLPPAWTMSWIILREKTKVDVTYTDAYNRLQGLASRQDATSSGETDKAYRGWRGKKEKEMAVPTTINAAEKECSYCKKHYPNRRRIRSYLEWVQQAQTCKEAKKKAQALTVAHETQWNWESRSADWGNRWWSKSSLIYFKNQSTIWILDTGASSHMTNNLDLLLDITDHLSTIELEDDDLVQSVS